MIITSTQNPKIKEIQKQMKDKSFAVLDSPKLIHEASLSGVQVIYIIKIAGYDGDYDYGGEIVEVSPPVFKTLCRTKHSQGLLAVVKFINQKPIKPKGNYLVLDELQDPGNVGTLIRSAVGAGFLDVYLLNSVKLTNDKVIRATMGAMFKVRACECTRDEFVSLQSKWNLPLYVCDMCGQNLYNTKFTSPLGIVVGNEGNGVSNELKQLCSNKISIPMQNQLESLNAGVSGSIVMYQIANINK